MIKDFEPEAIARLERIGGALLAQKMIQLFLEISPARLGSAKTAAETGDFKNLRAAVHPLKSSAAYVGALRVEELAAKLEKLAMAEELDEARKLVSQLEKSLESVVPILEKEVACRKSS